MSDEGATLRDLLRRSARRNGIGEAVVEQVDGVDVHIATFVDLYRDVNGLASFYLSAGLRPGDRIAVIAENSYDFCRAVLAAANAGLVAASINVLLGADDMAGVLQDLRPAAVVADAVQLERHAASIEKASIGGPVWRLDPRTGPLSHAGPGAALPRDLAADEPPSVEIRPEDPCLILYTSGSTGRPKGVLLSHRSLVMNSWSIITSWGFTPRDRVLVGLPMYHVSMWDTTFVPTIHSGATAVIVNNLNTATIFDKLHQSQATIALALPYMLKMVVDRSRESPLGAPPLRLALYGMAGMPQKLADEVRGEFGIAMASGFGQTESGGNTIVLLDEHHGDKCGSIGQPVANADVELMDTEGRIIAPRSGQVGEIVYRGPSIGIGYFNAETGIEPLADPWMHSGDLAYEDEDGFFWFQSRLRDVIKSGGENVYAAKVEQVISALAGVGEVAVVGKPSERWGEEVWAYVVLEEGSMIDVESIRQQAKAQLAPFEVPKQIVLIDALPKSAAGKVVKRRLSEDE